MYISLTSDVTPRKSQGVRPRGESRIRGRPGVITTRRGAPTREKGRDRSAVHHNPAVAVGAIRAVPKGSGVGDTRTNRPSHNCPLAPSPIQTPNGRIDRRAVAQSRKDITSRVPQGQLCDSSTGSVMGKVSRRAAPHRDPTVCSRRHGGSAGRERWVCSGCRDMVGVGGNGLPPLATN